MKKYLFAALFLLLSFVFVSCGNVDNSRIEGEWSSTRTIKTELRYAQDDPSSVYGYFYIKQTIVYDFKQDSSFQKSIKQNYIRTEISPEFETVMADQMEGIEQSLQALNSTYDITGKYELTKKKISYIPESYSINGETYNPDFIKENVQYLLSHTAPSKYSIDDDKLFITDELGNLSEFMKNIQL